MTSGNNIFKVAALYKVAAYWKQRIAEMTAGQKHTTGPDATVILGTRPVRTPDTDRCGRLRDTANGITKPNGHK